MTNKIRNFLTAPKDIWDYGIIAIAIEAVIYLIYILIEGSDEFIVLLGFWVILLVIFGLFAIIAALSAFIPPIQRWALRRPQNETALKTANGAIGFMLAYSMCIFFLISIQLVMFQIFYFVDDYCMGDNNCDYIEYSGAFTNEEYEYLSAHDNDIAVELTLRHTVLPLREVECFTTEPTCAIADKFYLPNSEYRPMLTTTEYFQIVFLFSLPVAWTSVWLTKRRLQTAAAKQVELHSTPDAAQFEE